MSDLKHFGVPGMRWGVRKNNPKTMSNAELKAYIERANLEKQYSELHPSKLDSARKNLKQIVGDAAKQTATKYVAQYMSKGVELIIKALSKK